MLRLVAAAGLFCVVFSWTLAGGQPAAAAESWKPGLPGPNQGYSWRQAAEKEGLGKAEIEQLARDKVLIAGRAYKQVFTPYLSAETPLFITSDSLLNGFHVLYEESVLRLERANARRLPGVLKKLWENLQTCDKDVRGRPELKAAAKLRAGVIVGTALRLLGEKPKADAHLAALIEAEVQRIAAARERLKPAWLGPPDPGFVALDCTQYKPRGFYAGSPVLEPYFRAVRWLQSIPFRVNRDEELLAILMLAASAHSTDAYKVVGPIRHLIGPEEDWDLDLATLFVEEKLKLNLDGNDMAETRKQILHFESRHGNKPQINDILAFVPDDARLASEPAFRILAAYRTPDAVLFQRTTDPRKFSRECPTGLEVAAALGSQYARTRLSAQGNGNILTGIDRAKPLFANGGLYPRYLQCLAALVDPPEPDAPAFMSSEPWQIKSCQTVLGGWAQMRHTWTLQAKQTIEYLGMSFVPPGFVEPEPEFFGRLSQLVEETHSALRKSGAFAVDSRAASADIRAGLKLYKREAGEDGKWVPSPEEMAILEKMSHLWVAVDVDRDRVTDGEKRRADRLARLDQLAGQLERGKMPADARVRQALKRMEADPPAHWRELGRLCRRLETLAHKQLRGVPFNDDENAVLRDYGKHLAGVMLYGGNSYLSPRDDAPRVVNVYSNPNVRRCLEVGVARAQAIYVLYPVKGGEVLCRGAVLPYHEFPHPAPLTDAQWKSLLDSPQRPPLPTWEKAIYSGQGASAPKTEHSE